MRSNTSTAQHNPPAHLNTIPPYPYPNQFTSSRYPAAAAVFLLRSGSRPLGAGPSPSLPALATAPPSLPAPAAAPPSLSRSGRRPPLRPPLLPLFPSADGARPCRQIKNRGANRAKDEQNRATWTPCGKHWWNYNPDEPFCSPNLISPLVFLTVHGFDCSPNV